MMRAALWRSLAWRQSRSLPRGILDEADRIHGSHVCTPCRLRCRILTRALCTRGLYGGSAKLSHSITHAQRHPDTQPAAQCPQPR